MAKAIETKLKLQIAAGKATPAPPVGPALGQHGINIALFVNQFNEGTKSRMGEIVPVEITVYEDRSFTLEFKTPPASDLLRKAAGVEKGSSVPNKNKAGAISQKQLAEIAEKKMGDLNANDVEAAKKTIAGTARSMGIDVEK